MNRIAQPSHRRHIAFMVSTLASRLLPSLVAPAQNQPDLTYSEEAASPSSPLQTNADALLGLRYWNLGTNLSFQPSGLLVNSRKQLTLWTWWRVRRSACCPRGRLR
jgi:hypothetical protein